jgi:tryptophan-rich sensory protein
VFFGAYDLTGAMVIITFLWITIFCYSFVSFKIDKIATYLFIPYLAWVSFAALLNFEYLRIN